MSLIKVTLIEIGQLATPAALVPIGGALALNNQVSLGVVILLLGVISYFAIWKIYTDTAKEIVKAQKKKEDSKLRRVDATAQATEKKHQLEQQARKERFGYDIARRIINS